MDKSLLALCDSLKKIIWQLKPQSNPLSFSLLTGKVNQGKSTLLRQSHFQHFTVDTERSAEIYYNQDGIIIELGESWLNQSKHILQHTLKQLNRCHRSLKITGIILCVDINELLMTEPLEFVETGKAHTQLLQRFCMALGYHVDTAMIFTKLDALAGFCEFFQYEHESNLKKPLGFSLPNVARQDKIMDVFKGQFDQLVEMLGQQVIHKMHPARSSLKRTLIREFPLQLASLRIAIQSLIQTLSPRLCRLEALYFTSAEQGGVSLDRLNKKIQHEYALTIQDTFPQSNNYRPFFIEGALQAFQSHTKRSPPNTAFPNKWITGGLAGAVGMMVVFLGYQHFKSSHFLDEASKELLLYESLVGKKNNSAPALYHLAKASTSLGRISSTLVAAPSIQILKKQVRIHTSNYLHNNFLPNVLAEIEHSIVDSQLSQIARYQALKVYLMLAEPKRFSEKTVFSWFEQHWHNETQQQLHNKLALLKQALGQPIQAIPINTQVVSDVRNYLNALPVTYLYYSLAKSEFPDTNQVISVDGFDLAAKEIPGVYTKSGFQTIIAMLPNISQQLQLDNWVLARQDLDNLPTLMQEAYCYEYVTWWQNFMHRSHPTHFQGYAQAQHLTQTLHQSSAINKLIDIIQQQTSPEFGDNSALFNREIASKFTSLSLLSHSAVQDLTLNINELATFLTTLSVVNDQGKTAFNVTKSRFQGDTLSNPLSALYARAQQLPDPVSLWIKQMGDDAWFLLINDTRAYINQEWQQTVYKEYESQIAKRYPFDSQQKTEVTLSDFDRFFAPRGILNVFCDNYLKPFLDTSHAQWQPKELNSYVLPFSAETLNELIRANVISNMFFPEQSDRSKIEFSLQKLSLDPVVASLQLIIGKKKLYDDQSSNSFTHFSWPQENAKLSMKSIEGNHYELDESGPWGFFKILQKVNVLVDEHDSSNLQILFEVNGNLGRYVLKTQNQVNPFMPGILNGFVLQDAIV